MNIARRRPAVAAGTAVLLVAGLVTGVLVSQRESGVSGTYVVPSFYATPSTAGSSGNCSDLTVVTGTGNGALWAGGVDANAVFTVLSATSGTGTIRSGTFVLSWNGLHTAPIDINAGNTAANIASQLAGLDPALSGVRATPTSLMPSPGTAVNGPLAVGTSVWISGVPDPDDTPVTVNDTGLSNGSLGVVQRGLARVISALPDQTEVDFTTNACYEVPGGIDIFDGGPAITFNGNPGSYVVGSNAELYDPDSGPDGFGEDGTPELNPILQEDGAASPATIEHLKLRGHDPSGSYDYPNSDNSAGIMLMGTDDVTVNDVSVRQVWGDCLTLQVDLGNGRFVINTNTVVENFSGNNCGRQGISPTSDQGLLVCGTSIGATGEGNAYDFENDFLGPFQYAQNVTITGNRCQSTDPATGQTVVTSGCYWQGRVVINNLFLHEGPLTFTGCVGTAGGSGGAVLVNPGGADATGNPETQNGPVTFSYDQFICPANGGFACVDVSAPWLVTVRSSSILVADPEGDPALKEGSWNSSNAYIAVGSNISPGLTVKWLYQERNTGADPLDGIAVTGTACPSASYQQNAGTNNTPGTAPPAVVLNPADFAVTNVTSTSPAEVTTSTPNAFTNSENVTVANVTGATAANGTWPVTVIDSTHFTIPVKVPLNNAGNPSYNGGGTAAPPLTAGHFTLGWSGHTTASLPITDTAAQVAAALTNILPGGNTVTGSGGPLSLATAPTMTLTGVPDVSNPNANPPSGVLAPLTVTTSGLAPTAASITTNAPVATNVLPATAQWTYACVQSNLTTTTNDVGKATGQDAVTGTAVTPEHSQDEVHVLGSGPITTTTITNPATSTMNESALALYGATLYLDSDCFSGALTNPPYGNQGGKSAVFVSPSTIFHNGDRKGCALRTETTSAPAQSGSSWTDTATVTGTAGPAQPKGTVSFYRCGATSQPQACTSKANPIGSPVTLTAVPGGASITSTATSSPPFTPSGHGWYCFAAYYSGATFTGARGVAYYVGSSDQSDVSTEVQPGGGPGTPYDGCFHVA